MKILVIGSGGREHALIWKIAQSKRVKKIYAAPGNAGISQLAEIVEINPQNISDLAEFALKERIDLTVVGPELPLSLGVVDKFNQCGLKIFGPDKRAARIEKSKVFSKNLLEKYNIPTAAYAVFDSVGKAKEHIKNKRKFPLVIKAEGLAAGKGVVICFTPEHAGKVVESMLAQRAFGEAGKRIIIEEFLSGEEASFMAFSDGKNLIPLASAQDHKTLYEDDKGPNTGGMGAYSPVPLITPQLHEEIMVTIMRPAIRAMAKEGIPYKGLLYAGLMIQAGKPRVLEFNARFGDPETQAILIRLDTDLISLLEATIEGSLDKIEIKWRPEASVCVVMAQRGYPGIYPRGAVIQGLKKIIRNNEQMIFHAGTALQNGEIITNGGRILGVTALGKTISEAIFRVYNLTARINWNGAYYRRDIGKKGINLTLPAP